MTYEKKKNSSLILVCKIKYLTTVFYATVPAWVTWDICIAPWVERAVRISTIVMVSIVIGIIIVFILPEDTRNSCSCRINSSFVIYSVIVSIDAINI